MNYYNPVEIIYGNGAIAEVKSLLKDIVPANGKVLVLTWNESATQNDVFKDVENSYSFYKVCFNESNPTVGQLYDMYCKTANYSPNVVVAIGGGSVMDVGKALCCFFGRNIQSIDEMRRIIAEKNITPPHVKWIGVPTTSGTGSEVTCWATIWDPVLNKKYSIESRENFAYAAIVDPMFTENIPKKLAVSSALDAVAHAVESYWAKETNTISRTLALGAINTVMSHIDAVINGDVKAHEYMAQGSVTAGLAFSSTRTTACHSISYHSYYEVWNPHGVAVSMLLAPIMEMNQPEVEQYGTLLNALGVNSAEALGERIKSLLSKVQIPCSLEEWE